MTDEKEVSQHLPDEEQISTDEKVVTKDVTLRNIIIAAVSLPILLLIFLFTIGFIMGILGMRVPVLDSNIAKQQWESAQERLNKETNPSASPTPTDVPTSTPTRTAPVSGESRKQDRAAGAQAKKLFDQATDKGAFWEGFNTGR